MTPTVYPVPADRVRDFIERARCGDEQADFIVHALAQYGRKAEQSCIDCRHAFIRRRPIATFVLVFPQTELKSSFYVVAVCKTCAADGIETVVARALTPTSGRA